jgi:hypothetical protein
MTNIYINGDNNVVNVVTSGQPVYISPSPSARRKAQISLDWNVIGVLIGLGLFLIFEINELPMIVLGVISVVCLLVGYGMEWREKRLAAIQARRRHAAASPPRSRPNDARVPLIRIKYGLGPDTNETRPEEKSSGLAIS